MLGNVEILNSKKMRKIAFVICFFSFGILWAQQPEDSPVNSGEDLIRIMYNTYSANWYHHLTFKQNIFRYREDSLIQNEIWLVAYSAPGKLHIRYKDFDSGRGWLVVNDTLYSFNHNKLIGQRPRLHEQITLGFDAYIVSPEQVLPKLMGMSFDLSQLSITTINGKSVYQVGDPQKHCFWVKSDDLLFYGIRRVTELGVYDMYFNNYKFFYGKPVATEIQYFNNGKLTLFEKYIDIRLPTSLPQEFFDITRFTETRW